MDIHQAKGVELELRDRASHEEGWTNVRASDKSVYSYRYQGDDASTRHGDVRFIANAVPGVVSLRMKTSPPPDPKPRYALIGDCITFVNDPDKQLTAEGASPQQRLIRNTCRDLLDAYYKVVVTDVSKNPYVTIACDPRIINDIPP